MDDPEHDDKDEEEKIEASSRHKPASFARELRPMMYGFGDEVCPLDESVDLMEDLAIEFIADMTRKAIEHAGSERIRVEDILFVIRKDRAKYDRATELLALDRAILKLKNSQKVDVPKASPSSSSSS
eukprot:TRINITY_DN2512_c0_g6_i1.p1 TRINITY_DN2512_c0_g6~~TRINITY_DN2512_c0_g6_i1.p1  ORF type:complete len:148 (-),score=28.61 TRINITY_DN2512_c0_g6_i1:154-534(-)